MAITNYVKTAEFATEKHVPVITAPDTVKAGERVVIELEVGKEIAHPKHCRTSYFLDQIVLM